MKYQFNFIKEIIVDSFAGGGGASTGIELALGSYVDIAINHDIQAIRMHEANHPFTRHYCENIFEIDPVKVCGGRPVAFMWASPDCTHFSRAKGGKPVKKEIRGLAWVVVNWAKAVRPKVIILENVPEFMSWGPIDENGKPIKAQSGETFKEFVQALRGEGYAVDWRVLKACDYGAPTSRKRLYLEARCDGNLIVWPKPTHGNGKGLLPYRTAAECIDFSIPCPSIFTRKKPLAENTLKRIARGLDKFVIKSNKPFIIPVGYGEHSKQKPRVNDIGKPLGTVVSSAKHNFVAHNLTKFQQKSIGQSLDKPIDTVMAGATRFGEVETKLAPYIANHQHKNIGNRADESMSTICGVNKHELITPILTHYHSETDNAEVRASRPDKAPLPVIDTSNRHSVAVGYLSKAYGGNYKGAGSELSKPLHTVTSQDHNHLTSAFMQKYYGSGSLNTGMDKPVDTLTTKDRMAVTVSHLTILRNNMDGKAVNAPMPTITAGGGHIGEVRTYLVKYTPGGLYGYWEEIRALLNTYGGYSLADDEIILFDINGQLYYMSDIGMRMLSPRELYNAQGFPPDYIIEHDAQGKAYPKTEQVARCGNSVCPPVARALVAAALPNIAAVKPIDTMKQLNERICAYA